MRIRESFAAAAAKNYYVQGNFLRVASLSAVGVSGSLDIVFFKDGQRLNIDLDNVDAGAWARVPSGFDHIEVTTTTAQFVELQINRGDVGTDRIIGEVSVLSGEQSRTEGGLAFSGQIGIGADATKYPMAQLFNPVASGRDVFLSRLQYGCPVAYTMIGGLYNTALLTSGGTPGNKRALALPAVAPAAVALTVYDVVASGPTLDAYMFQFLGTARMEDFAFTEPIMLTPGTGWLMSGGSVNATVRYNFQWWERPIV